MELVIWKQIRTGEWESPQGFKAYNVPEGWELIYETDQGQEITLHKNFKEARKKAQEIKGFKIPKHPKGNQGQWIKEPIGYCPYHHYFLSHTDAKNHECLRKGCTWLVKISSPHWDRRDEVKRNKKKRKANVKTE